MHARFLGPKGPRNDAFLGKAFAGGGAHATKAQNGDGSENYKLQIAKLQIAKLQTANYNCVQFFCRSAGLAGESVVGAALRE